LRPMPENIKCCPLCQCENHSLFEKTNFRGQTIFNRKCQICGFVFQSPRMDALELEAFYTREYRQVYQGEEGPSQKDLLIQKGRADALFSFVKNFIPKVSRHLDIGCSAGILLEVFRDHYGSQPVGVEPGDSYREHAKSKGITVYKDIDKLVMDDGEPFDLISMAHVLEHIPDPVAYLVKLRQNMLTPGGYLLLEVPNLFVHDSFETAHMSSFSIHTLIQTLKKSGFSILESMKHGMPRSKILPLYLTVLAQPDSGVTESIVVPEILVRVKRNFGFFYRRLIQKVFPKQAWIALQVVDKI
jgi:2-polyprenyl-3-methyl-5-hydroxy-6-metoxy-1,4-benzoquinol methylase